MEKSDKLTRTCSSCGIQKPLSAFLQLGGMQGASYGNVCSSCRSKDVKDKNALESESDDRTTRSGPRLRIGTAEKVYADTEQKRQRETLIEQHKEEAKKKDEIKSEKNIRAEIKQKSEKEHHKFYLDSKQPGFLTDTKISGLKVPYVTQKNNAQKPVKRQLTEIEVTNELRKLEAIFQHEQKLTTVDLQASPLFNEARYQTPTFMEFIRRFLGPSSPMLRYLENIGRMAPTSPTNSTFSQKMTLDHKKIDALEEYIDKTMGPSSRRR